MSPDQFVDRDLWFDSRTHTYTWRARRLTSVTQAVKALHRPFDAETNAARVAQREGRTTNEVLAEWLAKSDDSTTLGTAVHAEAERIADEVHQSGRFTVTPGALQEKVEGYARGVWRWYSQHIELAHGWAIPEVRVCHPQYGLAGTVDLICNRHGVPAIVDWKTTKTICPVGYGKMLPPVRHLPDSDYWGYALQLNLYRRILRDRHGYDAERMVIVWLSPGGRYQELEMPELDREVTAILDRRTNEGPL